MPLLGDISIVKKIHKQWKEKHLNFSDFSLETYKKQNSKHYSFIEVSI